MVDFQVVCSMCGDVGFSDKLFRCIKCRNRFQHSYCSNYYSEASQSIEICDWCQSEERNATRHGSGSSSRKSSTHYYVAGMTSRSEYSGDKIKQQHDREDGGGPERPPRNPNGGGAPSPRPTARRYKLLKDVMC